jgi:hypothetical protein
MLSPTPDEIRRSTFPGIEPIISDITFYFSNIDGDPLIGSEDLILKSYFQKIKNLFLYQNIHIAHTSDSSYSKRSTSTEDIFIFLESQFAGDCLEIVDSEGFH